MDRVNENTGVDAILGGLNANQRAAVGAPLCHRLVIAGPGSGKTRVLTYRVAWLIGRYRIAPQSILAVTFTRKAANEIKQRLAALVSGMRGPVDAGTFHSTCAHWLHQFAGEAGFQGDFQVIDASKQRAVIASLLKNASKNAIALTSAHEAQEWICKHKEGGRRWADVPSEPGEKKELLRKLYGDYEVFCKEHGVVDFAELILRCVELLRADSELAEYVRTRYRCLLVDEFQDTNAMQYEWVQRVVGTRTTLFAVGDDDQAIYCWRGADPSHMQAVLEDFPNVCVTRLEQNYRSTRNVVVAASALIANNEERFDKELWTEAGDGPAITVVEARNEYDEAEWIVNEIAARIAHGTQPGDIAVLYRANRLSVRIERQLLQEHVLYALHRGHALFERVEIKDALAWLRLTVDPDDDAAFTRACSAPKSGVGKAALEKLAGYDRGGSLYAAACAPAFAGTHAADFATRVTALREETANANVAQRVEQVISGSGLRAHHAGDKAESHQRLANLDDLVDQAQAYADALDTDETPSLLGFLEAMALAVDPADDEDATARVQLMTLHGAKGLEFPVVFIAGMEDGTIPDYRSSDTVEGMEEERRLAYVGMTRAREELLLSYACSRKVGGKAHPTEPSEFLNELPEERVLDILPALKGGDSFCKTAMSRRENVPRGVHVAVVDRSAFVARPPSYSKTGPTFRTAGGDGSTTRARLG